MTHEEYLLRLDGFRDSAEEVNDVLSHAGSCALCRKEFRAVERALARLEPRRRSVIEEVAGLTATAGVLVAIILGMHGLAAPPDVPSVAAEPRYRIVGNASGVVAYTPSGMVVGLAEPSDVETKRIAR
jgi:hypothetical protein